MCVLYVVDNVVNHMVNYVVDHVVLSYFFMSKSGASSKWNYYGFLISNRLVFFVWIRVCLLYVVDNLVNNVDDHVVNDNFKVKLLRI